MEQSKILENLCAYDIRNPDTIVDEDMEITPGDRSNPCYCDNCFYGRTQLAEHMLELIEHNEDLRTENDDLANQVNREGL